MCGCGIDERQSYEVVMMMPVTMDELARQSGYSKATVSRALNDDPRVRESTRKLIQALAAKHNYRPHAVASNLARRQTKIIGMLIPRAPRTVADPFFLEFLHGVNETLFMSGYSLLVPQVHPDREQAAIEQLIHQHRVDGLILTEPRLEDARVTLLQQVAVPFVFLGSTVEPDVYWVDGANEAGAHAAVQHLVQLGHRRIAVIAGEPGLISTKNRMGGYERALQDAGVVPQPHWVIHSNYTREGALEAVCRWLDSRDSQGITAIFACNDTMAIGALQALKRRGRRVPEDISLVGFDGIEAASYVDPPLTTVQQPIFRLGRVVSSQLLQLLRGTTPAEKHIVVPLELVIRDSSGQQKSNINEG